MAYIERLCVTTGSYITLGQAKRDFVLELTRNEDLIHVKVNSPWPLDWLL